MLSKLKYTSIVFVAFLISCSGSKNETESIKELKTHKEKLSYSFGMEQASQLMQGPNFSSFDMTKVIDGFKEGLKNYSTDQVASCQGTIRQLFGEHGQDFNTGMAKQASSCFGIMIGNSFMKALMSINGTNKISVNHVIQGFTDKLEGKKALLTENEKMQLMQAFMTELNKASAAEMNKASVKFLADAKQLPNTRVTPSGLIIQTIQEGKGASPKATDDVVADYILTNAKGDTMESSFKIKAANGGPPPSFNLSGVIAGWTEGFQQLKKGGKYKLFVPSELAYQQGALCFYIEFLDFGPAGTLAKKQ